MELKDIVCDLKYAKLLKKYGVDQTKSFAVFYGCQNCGLTSFKDVNQDLCGIISDRKAENSQKYFISTFTTEELLEMLPKDVKHNYNNHSSYYLCMGFDGEYGLPLVWYEDNDLDGKDEILISKSDKKLPNALAKVLFWLLKNKKFELPDAAIKRKEEKKNRFFQNPPEERIIYKKMPKRFYSFKHKSWILRTKTVLDGNWYSCDLTNESTGKKIDTISDTTLAKLNTRLLSCINNPKMF
jgi:hypothetical protein